MQIFLKFHFISSSQGHLFARNLYIDANNSLIPTFPIGFYLVTLDIIDNYGKEDSEHFGMIKYYLQSMYMTKTKRKQFRD